MNDQAKQSQPSTSRDEVRAKIFSAKNFKRESLTLFGAEVELRQPSLEDILDNQANENKKQAIAMMLVKYCYMPGTTTRVFEDADVESILKLPFGEDLQNASKAINRLTGIDVEGEGKNSDATTSA